MKNAQLPHDPYNLVISGVGGQGNVLASRVVGNMLSQKGLTVTIGETFGGSQRGGSVMSHLRISSDLAYSPQIPKGRAHVVLGLEPSETIRVLAIYGNRDVMTICNTRPIHPVQVIAGELEYPDLQNVKKWVSELSKKAWFINATDTALEMGLPILGNIIMIGALAELKALPLDREEFEKAIRLSMPADRVAINLEAFDKGREMMA